LNKNPETKANSVNLLIVIVILIAIIVAIALLKQKQTQSDNGYAFEARETLFTPAERSFLGVLEQSLDCTYRVFGKVRLADVIKPSKGMSKSKRTSSQNRINQKHLDFVICKVSDLSVVGVVELDDQSHIREDRAKRDVFVDNALESTKVPVIHFSAKKGYVVTEVRSQLQEGFKLSPNLAKMANTHEVPVENEIAPIQIKTPLANPTTEEPPETPACPACKSPMVTRQATKGSHAGKLFWACTAFPKCRQVVSIEG
jgi:ssDNA-binding Zn-finger/Zn-ribbon topoisomerase 1